MTREVVLGVDVGRSEVLALAVDPRLQVLGRHRVDSRPGADGIHQPVHEAVRCVLAAAGTTADHVVATGVGVPGEVEPGSGRVAHVVDLDLGRDTVDLAALLADVAAAPVVAENDVDAAAVGLHAYDPDAGDLALLGVGTGPAAGLGVDGALRRGSSGVAGRFGHLRTDPRGPLCGCSQRGCLEAPEAADRAHAMRLAAGVRGD